jgi:hypothetical protein
VDYRGSIILEVVPPGASPYDVLDRDRALQIVDEYVRESVRVLRQAFG